MTDCYSNQAAVARVGDALEERADEEQISWVIRRERDVLASPSYREGIPPVSVVSYDSRDDESLAFLAQIAARDDITHVTTVGEAEPVASPVAAWISWHPGAQLPRAARPSDVRVARRAADLHVRPADDRQPLLETAAAHALLAAIRQAQVT